MTTATTTQNTFRVIWKCRNRNCKHVWAFDYQFEGLDMYKLPYGSRELRDGETPAQYDKQGRRSYSADVMNYLRCPKCSANLPKGNRVEGHYSEKHICSAKCLSATGPACDCSCGGANHGAKHL